MIKTLSITWGLGEYIIWDILISDNFIIRKPIKTLYSETINLIDKRSGIRTYISEDIELGFVSSHQLEPLWKGYSYGGISDPVGINLFSSGSCLINGITYTAIVEREMHGEEILGSSEHYSIDYYWVRATDLGFQPEDYQYLNLDLGFWERDDGIYVLAKKRVNLPSGPSTWFEIKAIEIVEVDSMFVDKLQNVKLVSQKDYEKIKEE